MRKEGYKLSVYKMENILNVYLWHFLCIFSVTWPGQSIYWTIMCGARHNMTIVARTVNNVNVYRQSLQYKRIPSQLLIQNRNDEMISRTMKETI